MKIAQNSQILAAILAALAGFSIAGFSAPDEAPEIGNPQVASPPVEVASPRSAADETPLETIDVFGSSVQKRPLRAYILGAGENVTLIFAAVHGNETATPYLVAQLRAHLKKHPEILKNRRAVLVPVMNPDGLQKKTRVNANGVDINRNYPGTWKKAKRGDSFKSGPSAASEPEAQAMIRLVKKYRPDKIVSIHQPLSCLAYSGARSRTLARVIARENGYKIKSNIGYPTPGGFGGYCEKIIKTSVVTLELPWQKPEAAWKRNAKALVAAIALEPSRD